MSFRSHRDCVSLTMTDLLVSFQGPVQAALPVLQVCHLLRHLECELFLSPLLVLYKDSSCLRAAHAIFMKRLGGAWQDALHFSGSDLASSRYDGCILECARCLIGIACISMRGSTYRMSESLMCARELNSCPMHMHHDELSCIFQLSHFYV